MKNISTRKIIKIFNDGSLARVELLEGNIIRKTFKNLISFKKEVISLTRLQGSKHFPKIYKIIDNCVYMEYCGKSLDKNKTVKIPSDWKQQIANIKNSLIKNKINHNDILEKNICIINNTIKLIDFGIANSSYFEMENQISNLYAILFKKFMRRFSR